jgi:uncharacterized repeat protein (TIGR03803 family)
VTQGRDGNFYGTTSNGGQFNQGTVFRISPDGVETVLYSFAGGPSDGAQPNGSLIQGSDGNFYGTTNNGGIGVCPRPGPVSGNAESACGTVFTVTPDGAEAVLYFFQDTTDGGEPNGGLILGSDGNFYGTSTSGGLANTYCGGGGCGVVFKITPAGAETAVYAFGSQPGDGVIPSSVVQGSDGNFYGTAFLGGQFNEGMVFKVTPAGAETLLHSFNAGDNDGQRPEAPLVQGSDGNFYGTTSFGGISTDNPVASCLNGGCGTVFKITPAGALTALYAFGGNATDGANPYSAGLIQGSNGNLYGTTTAGGVSTNCNGGCGIAFSITPGGTEAALYLFAGGTSDGAYPTAGLVQGSDGNFYGTTAQGGKFNGGTVFRITPAGVETLLHSFGGSSNTDMNP